MIAFFFICLPVLAACECMDGNLPSVTSEWFFFLHLLLILLETRHQRHWQPCELRAHRVSGGINRDGTRSWSLGEKPYDPWKLAQTSFPQRLRRSYSHAFVPSGEQLRGLGSRAPSVAVCVRRRGEGD